MHARGEVGIAIRKEYQGNGYAKEALRLLCDYVFSFLYLKQLIVHISVDNEASIRLFESCGICIFNLNKTGIQTLPCTDIIGLYSSTAKVSLERRIAIRPPSPT